MVFFLKWHISARLNSAQALPRLASFWSWQTIFNKVSHYELSWSAVTCSSAGSHSSFQLHFSMFTFVFQVAVVSSSSLCCWFVSLNAFGVSSSSWFFGAGNRFLATVVHVPLPHPPSFFPSTDLFSVEWGLMAGLRDLPAMGTVFCLGSGWAQWKPLDIPGTHNSV